MKNEKKRTLITIIILATSFSCALAQWTASTGLTGSLSLRFVKSSNAVFIGTNASGIWKSTDDGVTWTQSSNGLNASTDYSITDLSMLGTNTLIASTYDNGVFQSTDAGANWTSITGSLPASTLYPAVNITSNNTMIIAAISDKGIYHSINSGATWTIDTIGIGTSYTSNLLIVGDTVFACTQDGLFKSSITTFAWFGANNGLPGTINLNRIYNQNDTLYLGTDGSGIYRSLNNGRTWSAINTVTTQASMVVAIAATDNNLYISTESNVYMSPKSSINWTIVGTGLPSSLNDLTISHSNLISATGTDGPYYYSISPVSTPTISVNGTTLTSSASTGNQWYFNGTIIPGATSQNYTATQNGSYTVKVNGSATSNPFIVSSISTGIDANSFSNSVNIYPNPFSSQTSISFSQPQINTTIKIVDILGNEIKNINFNGNNLVIEREGMVSGIYFFQIINKNNTVINSKLVVQ